MGPSLKSLVQVIFPNLHLVVHAPTNPTGYDCLAPPHQRLGRPMRRKAMTYSHFTLDERIELQTCLARGMSCQEIAWRVGKDPTRVSREIARSRLYEGVRHGYDGTIADIVDVIGGATPSKKKPEYYCKDGIGWITPRDLSNTTDKFIAHGADDITQLGYDSCSVKMLPAGTVLFSSRGPIGYIAIATINVTTNQGFKSVVPRENQSQRNKSSCDPVR